MFGIKKTLTISGEKNKSFLDRDTNLSHSGDDSKFIYYAKAEQFISQLEIYVKPNNYPDKKVLIIAKSELDFQELMSQIKESFKSSSEFKNVAGLTIENLYKLQNERRISLPKNGCINEYLKSGDIIYCDINTDEFWIKTYFKITTYNYRKVIKIEFKFNKKTKFKQIKLILLKAGIQFFWDELNKNKLNNSFNYYVKGIKFNNNKRKQSETGFELLSFNKKMKYLDNKIEILVNLQFGIFEELIHEQLVLMHLTKNEPNYLRLNEYCNLTFEELYISKKFESELGTVKDISKDFLTSQYNDLNSPFFFYNIKKNETVDEYMYNIINISNSIDNENDDDEDDDQFDFDGDTSFGKFYSDDPSKYFGDITLIKKTQKNYLRRHHNYDSNMIVIAPFLFKLIIQERKRELNNNINSNTEKIFRTFAHQNNKGTRREKQDLNNFFFAPLSLDNNKEEQNNLLENHIDEENDLILVSGKNNKIEDNIFVLDESQRDNKRYTVKLDDAMSHLSRRSLFSFLRLSKQSNCCNELYTYFSQTDFIENLKQKYKYYISKKIMEKINIPESRNYTDVDKSFLVFLQKKENEEDNSLIVKNKKVIIFLFIFFVYYLLVIIVINTEFINSFI
jgi:hypothetical protein